jgi:hypothetical protein
MQHHIASTRRSSMSAAAAPRRSHHANTVRRACPTLAQHVWMEDMLLSVAVCICRVFSCGLVWLKRRCACGRWINRTKDRHLLCRTCRFPAPAPTRSPSPPRPSTPEQVTQNVSEMMAQLPMHSHHRAPLVHHLSKGLSSATAARVLHTTASYVRQCKRKSYDDADLFTEKYAIYKDTNEIRNASMLNQGNTVADRVPLCV